MAGEIATIRIGADYFRNCAKKDYSNPLEWVWIREALQNSLDAGATKVEIELSDSHICVQDNGCGMTDETIQNKLLVLGGTQKAAGSVGGFGKAKEVLFFTWDWWSITSSPNKKETFSVTSEMIGKESIEHRVASANRGTGIWIDYSGSGIARERWKSIIETYVYYTTTRAKIYLNNEELPTMDARGVKDEYDFCTVIVNKSNKTGTIIVRIHGIPMFLASSNKNIEATVMVDLKGDSTQMLAANRDSLNWTYKYKLESILEKFAKNPKSAVNKAGNKPIVFDEYKSKARKVSALFDKMLEKDGYNESAKIVSRIETGMKYGENVDHMIEHVEKIDPDLGRKLRVIIKGQYVSPLGYTFVVKRDGNKRPRINPLCNKAQTILHCWHNIIEELMNKYYPGTEYVIGLTYEKTDRASYTVVDGVKHFLINPVEVPKYGDYLSLGNYVLIEATHEVSHVECDDHDEIFTGRWGNLMRAALNEPRKWKKLFLKAKQEIRIIANDAENEELEAEA